MRRLFDWRSRLNRYIATTAGKPFAWGAMDCAIFASSGIEAMTGADLYARFRGRYSTAAGAMRVLREEGFADLVELASSHFTRLESPALAQVGDLVAIPHEGEWALGIVIGERIAVMTPKDGYGALDRAQARIAFGIPTCPR